MPNDLFSPLSSSETAKKVRSTVYLTDEMIGYLGEIGKPSKSPQAKVNLSSSSFVTISLIVIGGEETTRSQ
jgi:hypothetical protein